MHRRPLLSLLERYVECWPGERSVRSVQDLVEHTPRCFERDCLPGHVTSSAWIANEDGTRFLLTHHRKLGRWLQLGGHTDGDPDVVASALREAREESGMLDFDRLEDEGGNPLLDVDVHDIPKIGSEPAHRHHDVRVLLVARAGQALRVSQESNELRWFEWSELEGVAQADESVLRLARKARAWLRAGGARGRT